MTCWGGGQTCSAASGLYTDPVDEDEDDEEKEEEEKKEEEEEKEFT